MAEALGSDEVAMMESCRRETACVLHCSSASPGKKNCSISVLQDPSRLPLVLFSLALLVGTGLGVEMGDHHHMPLKGTVALCVVRAIGKATVNFARTTQTCRVCSGLFALKTGQPFTGMCLSLCSFELGQLDITAEVSSD